MLTCKAMWGFVYLNHTRTQQLETHIHKYPRHSIVTGVLKWQDIDKEYAISFVFKGNFGRHLCQESYKPPDSDGKKPPPIQVISDEPNLHFFVLVAPPEEPVAEFYLSVTEDPIAGVGVEVSD